MSIQRIWNAFDCLLVQEYDWEALWPLIIPPIMTMLDDHEMRSRLSGIAVAEALINAAPTTLLQYTGVGELIEKVSRFFLPPILCSTVPYSR
jgi:hypothetical protein